MAYEVTFGENSPAGYALNSAKGGQQAKLRVSEFISSEDGDLFISRLEGMPQSFLAMLPPESQIPPSSIDHLVAIIRPNRTGTIYVNELDLTIRMRSRRAVKAGERVFHDDILDIERMQFKGVTFPADAGVAVLISVGWRKGLYYDLNPVSVDPQRRQYDVEMTMGQFYSYLLFQDLFKISQADWKVLFSQKWFPFIYLGQPLLKKMISYVRSGWNVDDLLDKISDETKRLLRESPDIWKKNPYAQEHIEIFEKAVDRYLNDDFISACSILFPRIEGLMRSYRKSAGIIQRPSGANLAKAVVAKDEASRHGASYLLPEHFREYLEAVYFKNFDDAAPSDLSRHSLAHGVVPMGEFTLKGATIGFLILYQLALFLRSEPKT